MLRFVARMLAACASFAAISLFAPAASALTDQVPPTAFVVQEDFVPLQQQWQPAAGTWAISEGKYNSNAAGGADIATIVSYRAIDPSTPRTPVLSFDQFTVSARMRQKGTTEGEIGVVYQYRGPANYYEAVIQTSGLVRIHRILNGSDDALTTRNVDIPRGTWFDLELQWNNGVSTVSVNGVAVISDFAQREFNSGRVGLVARNTTAQYDKVQVATPFGDQPFKHDFSEAAPGWMPQSGQWSVANGTYNNGAVQQTNVTLAPIHTGPGAGSGQTRDYTVHARMLNPYGGSGNLVGLVFDHTGPGYTEVVFSPTGVAKMNLVSNGRVQTLATAAYNGRRNVRFDVTLTSDASVWVDGQRIFNQVLGAHPNHVPEGGVGLITHWAPGRFDDVWFDHGTFENPCTETFSSNTVPQIVSGAWNVSGGTLNGTSVKSSSIALPCRGSGNFSGADAGTDFVYGARLLNEFGASGNLVGLIFNYQEQGRSLYAGDYYELVFSPTGRAVLDKFIEGVRYRVAEFAHNVPANTRFDVQLFRSGIFTTFKVNGATVAEDVPQGELRGGRIGVITHWTKAHFDDLSLQPYVVRSAPVTYTLTHIATPPPDSAETGQFVIFDLNDVGEIGGTRATATGQQAFIWSNGVFRNLNPQLPADLRGASAVAINNQSDVVGHYEDRQFQDHPFFLWQDGAAMPLSFPPGSNRAAAQALNNLGHVTAWAAVDDTFPARPLAYIWHDGETTTLISPDPALDRTVSADINDSDVVVGVSLNLDGASVPTVWDGSRGQDLNELINRQDPLQPFVHLANPVLINNRGQIVAQGNDSRRTDGRSSWYLLTPDPQR